MIAFISLFLGIGLFLWQMEIGIGYLVEMIIAIITGWAFSKLQKRVRIIAVGMLGVTIISPFVAYTYDVSIGYGALAGLVVAACEGAAVDIFKKRPIDGGKV